MARRKDFKRQWNGLLSELARNAAAQDRCGGDLQDDISALRDAGWLTACLPRQFGGNGWGGSSIDADTIEDAISALRCVGSVNMSVGRLFEGHMNAVKLIDLHAARDVAEEIFTVVEKGALLAVWGADRQGDPVSVTPMGDDYNLAGTKQFASGLGIVSHAVISAALVSEDGDRGTQLAVVPVGDISRQDPAPWQMAGMQATRSGHYLFDDMAVGKNDLLGRADAYYHEPYFEGGVWRYCAVHSGAADALYHAFRQHLLSTGRAGDTMQKTRLVGAAMAIRTADLWIAKAAHAVEAEGARPQGATLSLMAREATDAACLQVLRLIEQGMGMAAHVLRSDVERIRRDLRLFLCQAAPDAKRMRIADALLASDGERLWP